MFNELVGKVDDYLDGYISLGEFECWFFDLAFDVEKHWAGEFVDLVHKIEGILAESSSGNWSEATLDRELNDALSPYRNPHIVSINTFDPQKSLNSGRLWVLSHHVAL